MSPGVVKHAVDNCKNSAEEVAHYERTALDYEANMRAVNFRASELCFKALKKFEEKTGTFISSFWSHCKGASGDS